MAKKIAYLGLLSALAILIGYVESLIPLSLMIPGIKLGLCNLVIVFVLYLFGAREALAVSAVRVLVIGFLFGNIMSIAFSLGGTLLSVLIMTAVKKTGRFSAAGTSIAGGTFHNIGQLIVALAVVPARAVLAYLPVLCMAGAVTGLIIGLISVIMINRLSNTDFGRL